MTTRFHKGAFAGINLARAKSEPGYALYDGDDFTQLNNTPAETSGGYVTSEDGTATLIQEDQRPGIAAKLGTQGAAAHDALFMARLTQTAVGMFDITLDSGRVLAFESKFKVVKGLYVGIFVGLAETGLGDDIITDTTGAIQDKDVIGFHCAIHATDVDIDGITRVESGDGATVGADTMSEDEDDTFRVYGFRFDGITTLDWFYDNEKVASQTLTSGTVATGEALTPTFCVKHGAVGTDTQYLTIMDWQCVELLLSEDRLAD